MKVLVTGAGGFLGKAVVEMLLAEGILNLRCLARPSSDLAGLETIQRRNLQARIELMLGNLAYQPDARLAVQGIDVVYHLAAGMRGAPATIFLDTVVASRNLLDAIQNKNIRVVLVSSLGVYDTSHRSKKQVIDETCDLEPRPELRNAYFHAKAWQERLFREEFAERSIDLVVLRPGILYGKGNVVFPSRVGLRVGDLLLQFGGNSLLPLSHVINCAAAVVLAGQSEHASGEAFNLLDDDLPTADQYVQAYEAFVGPMPTLRFPFVATMLLSHAVQKCHSLSKGQIPRLLTPYGSAAMWKGHRFDNRKIKNLGWRQIVSTSEAMLETFTHMHASAGGLESATRVSSLAPEREVAWRNGGAL